MKEAVYAQVLVVEDDMDTATLEERALGRLGCHVTIMNDLEGALTHIRETPPDVVVLDFRLGSALAWPVLEAGVAASPSIPVIMVTAMGDERVASEAIQRGASGYVIKTGEFVMRLTQAVENALRVSRTERELQQMKEWQSAVLGSVDAQIALLDAGGQVILVNDAWREASSAPESGDETYGTGQDYFAVVEDLYRVEGPYAGPVAEGVRAVLNGKESQFRLEFPCVRRTGEQRWYRLDVSALRHGAHPGAVVMHMDISERVREEAIRLENAELLDSILHGVDEGILVVSEKGELLTHNKAAESILGAAAVRSGRNWLTWLDDASGNTELLSHSGGNPLVQALAGTVVTEHESRLSNPDGSAVYISLNARPLTDRRGAARRAVATFRDISERIARDLEMRRIAAAVEQTADAIIITDTDGVIEYVNPAFCAMYGYEAAEVCGEHTRMLRHTTQEVRVFDALWAALKLGETWTGRLNNRTKAGALLVADVTITPVRDGDGQVLFYVASERDVTQQIALEARARQSQKMEAIGVLAGGIAHDFNNILAAIEGYAHMAASNLNPNSQANEDLKYVIRGAVRAKALVRQILTFSRQSEATMKPVLVDAVITDSVELLRATLPSTVRIRTNLILEDALVTADETQVQQVIVNLCTNAAHAMKKDGGEFEIRLSLAAMKPGDEALATMGLLPGEYAHLEVSDQGEGIPQDVMGQIFDPFFSTKKEDGGTGLGLSTVLGIVKEHGGGVSVESNVGDGTCFHVYLPLCKATESKIVRLKQKRVPRGNGERILVVDDEEAIAQLSGRMLDRLGYVTTVFVDAEEAVAAFAENPDAFDLVLTDLTMPGIRGDAVAQKVCAMRPEMPVILLSGFCEVAEVDKSKVFRVLSKPAQMADLARGIHEALSKRSTSSNT